jgi:aryl sulfotransferase
VRRYLGWMADSRHWDRLVLRPDDIVISTPSKCGTTWMQNLVGMLVLGRADLDGLPEHPSVTYLTIVRHPLDVALSDRDHSSNTRIEVAQAMRRQAVGAKDHRELPVRPPPPEDATEHLRWWIDSDLPPTCSGPNSLADLCDQAAIAWERRLDDLAGDAADWIRRGRAALGQR